MIFALIEDKSWRVRNRLAQIFPDILSRVKILNKDLTSGYANLIKDPEIEVKKSSLEGLSRAISFFDSDLITINIIPSILALQNETQPRIKALIGESLGTIARAVGYTYFNNKLGFIIEQLIRDDNTQVRLG